MSKVILSGEHSSTGEGGGALKGFPGVGQSLIGEAVKALPLELDIRKKRLVLSRRQVLETEREASRAKVFETVHEGDVVEGTVKRLVDYGAFIDIGGVDGLAHISDLAWSRCKCISVRGLRLLMVQPS